MRVKIYSNEHSAWWKDNYCGYTNDESKAGIFQIEEVNKIYPYIDFDTTKEDYLVKFNKLTYEELQKENNKLKKAIKIIMKWRKSQMYDLMQNLEDQNIEGFEILEEVFCNDK